MQLTHLRELVGERTIGHAARFQCEVSRLGLGVMALDEPPLGVAHLGTAAAAAAAKWTLHLDPHLLYQSVSPTWRPTMLESA